jgi:hypothetical protein
MPRGANFSREELDSFLDSVEDILPLSTTQWESVVETHSTRYPDNGRTVDSLKRKFKELHIKRIPTGDGKWLFCSAGSLFCYLPCRFWSRSANLYGAEHFGE